MKHRCNECNEPLYLYGNGIKPLIAPPPPPLACLLPPWHSAWAANPDHEYKFLRLEGYCNAAETSGMGTVRVEGYLGKQQLQLKSRHTLDS